MEAVEENSFSNYDTVVSQLKGAEKVPVIIEIDIDEFSVSYDPKLPIFTYGDSIETAKSNAIEALYFTFEEYIPDIKDHFEITFIES